MITYPCHHFNGGLVNLWASYVASFLSSLEKTEIPPDIEIVLYSPDTIGHSILGHGNWLFYKHESRLALIWDLFWHEGDWLAARPSEPRWRKIKTIYDQPSTGFIQFKCMCSGTTFGKINNGKVKFYIYDNNTCNNNNNNSNDNNNNNNNNNNDNNNIILHIYNCRKLNYLRIHKLVHSFIKPINKTSRWCLSFHWQLDCLLNLNT